MHRVPKLDHDKMMAEKYGSKLNAQSILERRITARLLDYLAVRGWHPVAVLSDESEPCHDTKSAMELIFNLDEAWVEVKKHNTVHCFFLVLGNGQDIISDWRYSKSDTDGFNAAMEFFLDTELEKAF